MLITHLATAQEYNFINYNVKEGLPQSQVYDLFQDSKSYLWMATQGGGVTRFDGDQFQTLTTKDGLPSNYVQTIFEDSKNTIWFGTKTGLASFNHKEVTWSQKAEMIIHTIHEHNDSTLWLGTQRGIHSFNKKTFKLTKLDLEIIINRNKVNDFWQVNNALWVATSRGIFIIENDEIKRLSINEGLLSEDIKHFEIDHKGNIWAVQFAGGISCINPKTKTIIEEYNQKEIQRAQHLFIDDENQKWISTQNRGIYIYNPIDSSLTAISEQAGLSHNNVQSVFQDTWGNKWIATSGGGVNKFLGQFFAHYNTSNGLNANRVYAIAEDTSETVWLSIAEEGITTIDSLGLTTNIDSAYITTKCNHIFEDSKNRMWMSTNGEGLVMKDTTGFRVFTKEDGLPSNWIKTCIEDTLGNVWVGTYADGLGRINSIDSLGLQVDVFQKRQGLPDVFITALVKDPSGKIWFATKQGGLGFIDNNEIVSFDKTNGLPNVAIRSIAFDKLKNIWIGTAGEGVFVASYTDNDLQFQPIEKASSLTSDNVYSLLFDEESNLWVGNELGVDKINFNSSGVVLEVQHFGKNEGFIGIETCHNAALLDSEGYIWFGTLNGLTKHKPGNTSLSILPPKIHFTGIELEHEDIAKTDYASWLNAADSLDTKGQFKHHQNDFGFNFKAIHLDYPNDILYQWKLEGLDEKWSEPSKTESVKYNNLSPSNYQFKVKAIGKKSLESQVISTSFSIKPAYWQQPWFWALMALLGLLLIYFFYRYRVNQIRKKEAKKRAQLELENELLGLEQKALQLQMNPHFIFNALNSIQGLVVNNKTDIARDQIQNFASLMRGILSNSKKTRISLSEEYLTLDKYLKTEQFCQAKPFNYEIILPEGYDADEVEIPPMMIQPFVENAVFHGVSHLNKKGKIVVQFDIQNELLSCSITDNGVGRQKAQELNQQKKGHQSTAINVTKQRLESLKDGQNYNSFLIDDIKNESGEVKGTKVVLTMPLEINF